jgi:hypothetical protein
LKPISDVDGNARGFRSLTLVSVAWSSVVGVWNRDVDVQIWNIGTIHPSFDGAATFGRCERCPNRGESPSFVEKLLDSDDFVVVIECVEEVHLCEGEFLTSSWTSGHMYSLAEYETLMRKRLCTLFKNDTLTILGFGLRDGYACF